MEYCDLQVKKKFILIKNSLSIKLIFEGEPSTNINSESFFD